MQYEQRSLCCCINSWQQIQNRTCSAERDVRDVPKSGWDEVWQKQAEQHLDGSEPEHIRQPQAASSRQQWSSAWLCKHSALPFPIMLSPLYGWSNRHAHWQLIIVLMCLLLPLGKRTHFGQIHTVWCCIHVTITDTHPLCTVCRVDTISVLLKQCRQAHKLYLEVLAQALVWHSKPHDVPAPILVQESRTINQHT